MAASGNRDDNRAPPRVKVIETSYVTITDPSRFKSIVQSLTGAAQGEENKAVRRKKRVLFEDGVGGAGKSGVVDDKRQCCGELLAVKGDSELFKEELQSMLGLDSPPVEDQFKWMFNDHDSR